MTKLKELQPIPNPHRIIGKRSYTARRLVIQAVLRNHSQGYIVPKEKDKPIALGIVMETIDFLNVGKYIKKVNKKKFKISFYNGSYISIATMADLRKQTNLEMIGMQIEQSQKT